MWGMRANKASKAKKGKGVQERERKNNYTNGEWRETVYPEERKQEIMDVKWQ